MKVRIDAGGREVEIEASDANLTPGDLAEHARRLWEATAGAPVPSEPGYGFTQERRERTIAPTSTYGPFTEPRAAEERSA